MSERDGSSPAVDVATAGGVPEQVARVRALNDALRRNFTGGRVVMTAGVAALPLQVRAAVLVAVQGFDAFEAANDPHGEHDFGALSVEGERVCWKIDTYDLDLRHHSPDPADPAVTVRVLTVMLAEEWQVAGRNLNGVAVPTPGPWLVRREASDGAPARAALLGVGPEPQDGSGSGPFSICQDRDPNPR